jgi:hypothetical protein
MIEKANIVQCTCSIVMGAAGVVNYQNGCTIVRSAAGIYTIVTDQATAVLGTLNQGTCHPIVSLVTAALLAQAFTITQTNTTNWSVQTMADIGGAAADVVGQLCFTMLSIGGLAIPATGGGGGN